MERNLSKWMTLAAKWNAIVLIDEAETYMSSRAKADLGRHALITGMKTRLLSIILRRLIDVAFLRGLEYYPGMIFLVSR